MSHMVSEEERYQRARRRVKDLRGFYSSLGSYITVNLILFGIDLLNDPGHWWFYKVSLIWGFFLVIHAIKVFNPFRNMLDAEWEERKIREYMGEKPKRTTHNDDYFEES